MSLSGHRGVVSDYEWTPAPQVPGAVSLQSIEKALSALYFTFVLFQKNVPRMLSSPPQHVLLLLSLPYTDWLTANLLEGPRSRVCGSRPPSLPCLFMLPREPPAGLRTGPGGRVPVLDTGAVPWGRDTASWAATEVSCKKLDALEPGQCRSWCTCHRRVCWHGLACHGVLVGLCRASLPASCSSGFWFLRQLGFQDLGKSGLGGCGWFWRDELGGPLTAEVGFSKQERRAARGSGQTSG